MLTYFGLLLYAINQQETAIATATKARRAVMMRAIINPIIDTQMSSTRCAAGLTVNKKQTLIKYPINL
jgi:hypothetical protein